MELWINRVRINRAWPVLVDYICRNNMDLRHGETFDIIDMRWHEWIWLDQAKRFYAALWSSFSCTLKVNRSTHKINKCFGFIPLETWILRSWDRDISLRFRYGHLWQVNRIYGHSKSGHMWLTCGRCPYLNLSDISLFLSEAKSTHLETWVETCVSFYWRDFELSIFSIINE